MIDPDCRVWASVGCVKTIQSEHGAKSLAATAGPECPANVFAPTALKSLTLATYSMKDRQHNTSASPSSRSCADCTASGWQVSERCRRAVPCSQSKLVDAPS